MPATCNTRYEPPHRYVLMVASGGYVLRVAGGTHFLLGTHVLQIQCVTLGRVLFVALYCLPGCVRSCARKLANSKKPACTEDLLNTRGSRLPGRSLAEQSLDERLSILGLRIIG